MDILFNFLPFVFSSNLGPGRYVSGLPLKTPLTNTLSSHGRIFGLFEINYPDVFHLENITKDVFSYFENLYYGQPCHSVHEHLLSCMRETQVWLDKQTLEFGSVDSVDFSLCIGVVWGGALYVAKCGSVALRIYRDESFGNVFDFDKSLGADVVSSVSGQIQAGDTIVLYNSVVDGKKFPLSTKDIVSLDTSLVYSRLSGFFDGALTDVLSGCIVGFYLSGEAVPSVEEESLVVGEVVDEGVVVSSVGEVDTGFINRQMEINRQLDADELVELAKPSRLQQLKFRLTGRMAGISGKVPSTKFLALFTKRRLFIVGFMVLLLFIGLIFTGRDFEKKFSQEQLSQQAKQQTIPKIKDLYNQGLYYANLNPDRAKSYLKQAQSQIAELDPLTKKDSSVQKLSSDIDAALSVVTKVYDLANLQPFFDLNALNTRTAGEKLSVSDKYLLVSDTKNNTVYEIDSGNKSASALIGPNDLNNLYSADGDGSVIYAASERGVVKVKQDDTKVTHVLEGQSSWGSIKDIYLFGSSLYMLDAANNQIWKYIPEGSGFGTVRNYISSDTPTDLHEAVSFAIDGNVWVANQSGEVFKFVTGKLDSFSLPTIDDPLKSVKGIYTDTDTDYLYLLDSTTGRVVVFDKKDGNYVSTYKSSAFIGSSDLVVDLKNKQLYVLTPQKIYRTDLHEAVKESSDN